MEFPHGRTVIRDRREQVSDPYNPAVTQDGDWDPELSIVLEQAFVASSSSSALRNETREQILTAKSLYLTDVDADVLPADRIRDGGDPDNPGDFTSGTAYTVPARPEADTNPFTGWQPAVEIPLERVEG